MRRSRNAKKAWSNGGKNESVKSGMVLVAAALRECAVVNIKVE